MANPARSTHLLRRQHNKLLKCGQSWMKNFARYTAFQKDKVPKQEHVKLGSQMGQDLPNPVQNTEWEYFERIRNPNYKEIGPIDNAYFTRKQGVTKFLFSWLHWDINIDDTEDLMARSKRHIWRNLVEDQAFNMKRHKILGPDLSVAHMLVARGAAVKFVGRDTWVAKSAQGKFDLPRTYVDNLFLEAIDASNTNFTYVALDNFEGLEHLRFIRFHNCEYVDDTCLVRLQRLKHSLEFVDLCNCTRITDTGITALHTLSNLQGLKLANLSGVNHLGLLALLLEEHLPQLTILGLTEADLQPPPWAHRGERKLVQALLGLGKPEDALTLMAEDTEYVGKYSHDSIAVYGRRVHPVD